MPAHDDAELARLTRDAHLRHLARRSFITLDGAAVAVVAAGWFRIFRDAAYVRDVTLALAGPGELLAPGALFGERSAESGAQAITDGTVALVAPATFASRAQAEGGLYVAIARSLSRRTALVQHKLEAFSRATVEARVAAALLEIAGHGGVTGSDGSVRLDLPLSQADLAGLAGTTRESASSAVAGFARAGLVRGSRLRGLVLLAPERLAELAAVDFRQP